MTQSGPPYICISKEWPYGECLSWCGRPFPLGGEIRYRTAYALDKKDEITCPTCLHSIGDKAHPRTPGPHPHESLGWFEAVVPFISLGFFTAGIAIGKDNFAPYGFALMVLSILTMASVLYKMIRGTKQAHKASQANLDALLEKSPNKKVA